MNTNLIAKEYRLSHWAGVLRDRQESGLRVRAYCEREGFHENIYFTGSASCVKQHVQS
jgi:hypothetical protein